MEPKEDFRRVEERSLTPVTEIDIRELAEIRDEKDVYLSVYLPTASREDEAANRSFVDARRRAIKDAISGEMRSLFKETMEMVDELLFARPTNGERGRIVFASAANSFLQVYRIGIEPVRAMVLDTSPFLLPLAKLRDDYSDYGVLLLDSKEARLFCVRSDVPEEMDHLSTDLMNRHKKGGWSQMRFNRLRKGAIKSFLSEVAEDVQESCSRHQTRGLVVAGPGDAKKEFLEILPAQMVKKILAVVDLPIDAPPKEIVEVGDEIALADERARSMKRAEQLRSEILRGGLAVQGVEATRDALNAGRASVLVLLKDASIPGWICERCQALEARRRPPSACPSCGGPPSPVDVVEELYELAVRTGAEVEFVEEDA
ncbi:MAG TPA: Vms1/Ankzf1 family peptidyl-tRNA hydrolase, partial [Methanothrix sp.]|nr:Vms1/Ankzf1 family peptidyl-tRNA hydrolase [Methanothrix sp.]